MFKQFILVLICCAFTTVRAAFPCLGAPPGVFSFTASPESCAHYITCTPTGEVNRDSNRNCLSNSNNNTWFDPIRQVCTQASCMDCSPFGIQNLPHPHNCVQYLECVMGTRAIRTCQNGLLFDRRTGQCNRAHEVFCPNPPTEDPWNPWPTTQDPWNPTTQDPWNPTTQDPWNPWPTTQDPWNPTTQDPWNPTTQDPWNPTTQDPWNPTTQDPWNPTSPPGNRPVCIPGQVFHAHPSDCTRFFMCINLVLWEDQCLNGLHWNQLRNTCDLPQYAGCVVATTQQPTTWSTWNPWDVQSEDKKDENGNELVSEEPIVEDEVPVNPESEPEHPDAN